MTRPNGEDGGAGFRDGGADEYERVLTEEHERAVAELRERIAGAKSEQERRQLERKLDEAEAEFRRKLKNAERSLF